MPMTPIVGAIATHRRSKPAAADGDGDGGVRRKKGTTTMVRYNPITGEEMPSYQTHADHLRRREVVSNGDDEVEEVVPASGSTLSSDVSDVEKHKDKGAASIDDDKSPTSCANTFEDMVAAEMERLRLDYGQEDDAVKTKKNDAAAAAAAAVPAASTIAPSVESNHHHHHHHHQQQQQQLKQMVSSQSSTTSPPHNSRCISTSLLGRDEGQELATRRQRAREYGEQLRLQMEQDRLAKTSRRTHDAPRDVDVDADGISPASASISTAKATDAAASSAASYGELLRLQIKEDEERRRKQREDNRSGLHVVAKASIDAIGDFTDSLSSSKEQKAAEYRRQLDDQIAAKSSSHRASKSSGTDCKEAVDGQLEYQSNQAATSDRKKKNEYALQLREQMDAKAARHQRSDSIQAPESSSNASSVVSPWILGEEREVQERQRRRDAALEQQRLLELQIQEQNEARAKLKKEGEDNQARNADLFKSRHSALPSHARDEVAVAPIEEPSRPSNTLDDCPLLAAQSTFIPTPKPKIRRKADEYTAVCQSDVPICPMKSPVIRRGRGGEAFTVSLEDASEGANSGMASTPPTTIRSYVSGVPTNLKATKCSPCRRSRSKSKSATASSVRRPPLEPAVSPSEEIEDTVVDEDDVLVQDILRSALRRIEDNVPINDEGSQEVDSLGPPKKKKSVQFRASETSSLDQYDGIPSVPIEERDAYLPNGSSDYADALGGPFQVDGQDQEFVVPSASTPKEFEADNFDNESLLDDHFEDLDEYCGDDEEVEEEKLMQALSRIRNSMDTSFAST